MNNLELLKTQADCISSIDKNILSGLLNKDILCDMVMLSADLARECSVGLGMICVSAHPTVILQSPCGNLFIDRFIEEEGHIISFNFTNNPRKAIQLDCKWAEKNAHHFKNGEGEFIAVNQQTATENVCLASIKSTIEFIDMLIQGDNNLTSLDQIQSTWYHGEFWKADNKSLNNLRK